MMRKKLALARHTTACGTHTHAHTHARTNMRATTALGLVALLVESTWAQILNVQPPLQIIAPGNMHRLAAATGVSKKCIHCFDSFTSRDIAMVALS
jgi:hypothetical protein